MGEINVQKALELHADMCRTHALVGWVVMQDSPKHHPHRFIARLIDTQDFLVADSLTEIQAKLPPRLLRMERQPADPPEVVELWTQGPKPSSTGSASINPFQDAMSLLTAMSTATQLFVGLTGAVWVVVVPNTMALPTSLVVLALSLHALLGLVLFMVLRGLGANLVQRLNRNRWTERYGDKLGMGDAAWFGIPPLPYDIKPGRLGQYKSWFKHPKSWFETLDPVPDKLKDEIEKWTGSKEINTDYAVPRYPTLRIQRTAWPLVPLFGAACSIVLGGYTFWEREEHTNICKERFTFLQQASTSLDFERARYLLDKASCDNVSTQRIFDSTPPVLERPEHKAACDEGFALLRRAATSLDLDRARHLLDKANCSIGSRPVGACPNGHC